MVSFYASKRVQRGIGKANNLDYEFILHITPFRRTFQWQRLDQGPARCPLAAYVPRFIPSPSA